MTKHMSGRKFGVELEVVGLSVSEARFILTGSKTLSRWEVKSDCSISDSVYNESGCEIVSPPLKGRAGLAEVRKVVELMRRNGARANDSCGLHVHVDASDISVAWSQRIMARYMHHETAIENFMPRRRRNSPFALPMTSLGQSFATMLRPPVNQTMSQFCLIPNSRYYRVNFCSYLRHGTLEFRQHSGSVSAESIENWILFVLNFVEASKPTATTAAAAAPSVPRRRGRPAGARVQKAVRLLRRLEMGPASAGRLAWVCDVSESSIPAMISWLRREHGIMIKNVAGRYADEAAREYKLDPSCDNIDRFDAFMAAAEAQRVSSTSNNPPSAVQNSNSLVAPVFLADYSADDMYKGLDRSVIAYFRERTTEMAAG